MIEFVELTIQGHQSPVLIKTHIKYFLFSLFIVLPVSVSIEVYVYSNTPLHKDHQCVYK